MKLRARLAVVGVIVSLAGNLQGQSPSPFFCKQYPNHGFDCVVHTNIDGAGTVLCPDPLLEPWCACLKTFASSTAPNAKISLTQEVLFPQDQPTAGTYSVDVSRGTLDLSAVSVGDVVFNFIICVDGTVINVMEPACAPSCPPFNLNFEGVVTTVGEGSVDVDLTLPPDTNKNLINVGVLEYDPVDVTHSFGKTYVGKLASRGPGKGFTFEYEMYVPDPMSASPLRGVEDGDLDDPGFTIEALMILADEDIGLYTTPPCGRVAVGTLMTPKIPIAGVPEEEFETILDFGGGDYTVGIGGSTTADVGASVLLTATTDAAEPPAYVWEVVDGTGDLTDNKDGTANVTSSVEGSVTVRLTGTACSASKTAEATIQFGPSGGLQKPGDSNQDGNLDISDPVDTLGFLFLGTKDELPCGDGLAAHPANLALLNVNGDAAIDLSEPVYLLNFLFTGGAAPVNCFGNVNCPCAAIADCPTNDKCQ